MSELKKVEIDEGKIVKTILKEGLGDETPPANCKVKVHYTGTLHSDGSKFDSSVDRGTPFEFTLGIGQVIKGWDKGIATMKRGEKAILTCQPEYAYGERGSGSTIPPNAVLDFEVEMLDWEENDNRSNVTDDGRVKILVEKEGKGWKSPTEGATATVKLTGYIGRKWKKKSDAAFLDISEITVSLDDVNLPEGLEEGLKKMAEGEESKIFVSPEYAYGNTDTAVGDADAKPLLAFKTAVPANSSVIFDVTMVSFENPKEDFDMTYAEKVDRAVERKNSGNAFYTLNKLARAVVRYEQALNLTGHGDAAAGGLSDEEDELTDKADDALTTEEKSKKDEALARREKASALAATCYSNLAMVSLKQKSYASAIEFACKGLELDAQHAKLLTRRGQAYLYSGSLEEALVDLKAAVAVAPTNKVAVKFLAAVKSRKAKQKKKQKKLYGNMFSKVKFNVPAPGKKKEEAQYLDDETDSEEEKAPESEADRNGDKHNDNDNDNGNDNDNDNDNDNNNNDDNKSANDNESAGAGSCDDGDDAAIAEKQKELATAAVVAATNAAACCGGCSSE